MEQKSRLEIAEPINYSFSIYDLDGKNFSDIIKYLTDLPKKVAVARKIDIDKYHEFTTSYDYDDHYDVFGVRYESDEEYNARMDKEYKNNLKALKAAETKKKRKEEKLKALEDQEKSLLKKLKQKYES